MDNEKAVPIQLSQKNTADTLEWHELYNKIRQSGGAEYEKRMYEKSVHLYTLLKNASEVIEHLDGIRSSLRSGSGSILDAPNGLASIQLDFSRKLFNFLASTAMLVDYTRAFMCKNYCETDIMESYLDLVRDQVKTDPLCLFVKELRHLGTHVCNPMQSINISVTREGSEVRDCFDPDGLLSQRSNWNSTTKEYINKMKANPEARSVVGTVAEYVGKIKKLHQDIDAMLRKHHKNDILELTRLRQDHVSKYHQVLANWPILPIETLMPPMDYLWPVSTNNITN
ncbi:hypothetical protein HMI48_01450 [Acidithiobacillus ferrooxidans]|uniref:hypothetical protein n=1 Tax=Acidithiobacillus ferrooxidans TaxID=920 RepID=UPI001C06A896|nr:hypothetical protein [Acidithiobacillus ferrooxidans]MBU2772625.1 hypothetical protein [Acidithiobacillus ferrooxidans]